MSRTAIDATIYVFGSQTQNIMFLSIENCFWGLEIVVFGRFIDYGKPVGQENVVHVWADPTLFPAFPA